ncbi:glycosyltransferase family 25 protein [Xanthobacteraceae bacterium A53D]
MNAYTSTPRAQAETARVTTAVISMPSATARRQVTSDMLSGKGLAWSYFDAHTALSCPDLHYDEAMARIRFGRPLGRTEMAVYSSHYAVWSAFVERGDSEYLLVLEDDVLLDMDFPIAAFAAFCGRHGMDYVRLFGKHYAHAVRIGFYYDRSLVRFATSPAGTQAYILSRAGARRLLDHCRSLDATIDLVMDRFWETGLPLYSIFPYPAIERYVPTSIPIPSGRAPAGPRGEWWKWQANRVASKARKAWAHQQLGARDDRMRTQMPAFAQICAPQP